MSFWLQFFRDAGIPPSPAKSYTATFEDNRISKDMLLDLNKEILNDMGIRVMGDIICILKHAKKVHHNLKLSHHATSPSAVTTTSALHKRTHSQGDVQVNLEGLESDPILPMDYLTYTPGAAALDGDRAELGHYSGGLKSDQLLSDPSFSTHQTEMAYYRNETSPSPLTAAPGNTSSLHGGQLESQFLESYTTAAYESTRQKRPLAMYSDVLDEYDKPTASKLPKVEAEVNELDIAAIQVILESSGNRKLLEAAGLMPVLKGKVSSSVFSRLETSPRGPVKSKSSEGITTRPVGSAKNLESSSKRVRITKPAGTRTSAVTSSGLKITSAGGPSRSAKRALTPPPKLPPLSPAASGRVSERLGGREKERVSTSSLRSMAPSSVPVRERITLPPEDHRSSIKEDVLAPVRIKKRLSLPAKEHTSTSVKDRLSSRPSSSSGIHSRLSGRLGTSQEKSNYVSTTSSSRSQGTRFTRSSMVADEYESVRQADIRSRMEHKEKVKKLRREGPLAGRLAKPDVFGRLE